MQWKSRSKLASFDAPPPCDRARCLARLADDGDEATAADLRVFVLEAEQLEPAAADVELRVDQWICCYCNRTDFGVSYYEETRN